MHYNKEATKALVKQYWGTIQRIGFWVLLLLMAGGWLGLRHAKQETRKEVSKAVALGNFTIDLPDTKTGKLETHIFDIKERIVQ